MCEKCSHRTRGSLHLVTRVGTSPLRGLVFESKTQTGLPDVRVDPRERVEGVTQYLTFVYGCDVLQRVVELPSLTYEWSRLLHVVRSEFTHYPSFRPVPGDSPHSVIRAQCTVRSPRVWTDV